MNKDSRSVALGQEVRAEAAGQRITLTALAKMVGMPRSGLYNYLDAERDMPYTVLNSLADALRVPPFVLIERAEDRARRNAGRV